MTQQTTTPPTENTALISVEEACRIIGNNTSARSFYEWVKSGRLPEGIIFRPSRRVFVLRAKLLEWLGTEK